YYVNDLNSDSIRLGIEDSSLALTVHFFDNDHALHTPSIAPDINSKDFSFKVKLPMRYDQAAQYFYLDQPQVEVSGAFAFNGPASGVNVEDWVKNGFRDQIAQKFQDYRGKIEHLWNQAIRSAVPPGGRLTEATVNSDNVQLTIAAP